MVSNLLFIFFKTTKLSVFLYQVFGLDTFEISWSFVKTLLLFFIGLKSLNSLLKKLSFGEKRKIKCKLRALPNEISGSIATSLIFSAWNASIYVNQIDDEKVMRVEKTKNYEKIVQQIVAKNKGLYFNNEIFVIQKK